MIFAVSSQKGGTGKTTTIISLASGLARKGKTVLLIDMDSQANSSKVLLPNYPAIPADQTIYKTIIKREGVSPALVVHPSSVPNLSVVPSHILLSNTDLVLSSALDHREARLKHELDKIKDHYDHIIIDCPPALSWLTINAFTAAERVVIVVSPGYFELDSVVQLANTMMMVQQEFNPELQLAGILFTMSDQTNNTETSLKLLRQAYPSQVFKTIIPRNVEIQHAHMDQKDIFAFNPNAKAAHAYDKLIAELIAL